MRPPIVRRRAAASEPTRAPGPDAARPVRPVAERTAPLRTADKFLRVESGAAQTAPKADSPVANAVSQAYQVFDRYLKEGQAYAAGQSAWYNGGASVPSSGGGIPNLGSIPGLPGLAGIPTLPNMQVPGASADMVTAALRFFDQMRQLGSLPASPVAPAADWPKPRWPQAPGNARWVDGLDDTDESTPR